MIETAERQEDRINDIRPKLHLHKQLHNLGFKFQLQFKSSRTEAAKKPRGRAYFYDIWRVKWGKTHTLGSSCFFEFATWVTSCFFLWKKFMGILPGLHSISFTCISNMRTSWNMGFFESELSNQNARCFLVEFVDVGRCHFLWCVTFSQGETDGKAAATGAEHTKSAEDSDWCEPPMIEG